MAEKRFVIKPSSIVTDGFVIIDKEKKYTFPVLDSTLNYMFNKALNELHEENEELKSEIAKLSYANEDLLEEKRQWKILSDKYAELYDENEQLKSKNNMLKHTIGRNEAYIKKLTETSEWHC